MSRLRVGLLVGAEGPKAWHEQVVTILRDHEKIDLVGLVEASDPGKRTGALQRWLDLLETGFSHKLFRTARADRPLGSEKRRAVPTLDAEYADGAGLDLLVSLDGVPNAQHGTNAPTHGVWHLTFDGVAPATEQVGVSGWYEGRHVVGATLWRRDGSDEKPAVVERAHFGVFKPSWSVNRSRHLWRAALLIADNVVRLATLPQDSPKAWLPLEAEAPSPPSGIPHPLLLGLRFLRRLTDHIWRKLAYIEQWQILASRSAEDRLKPKTYARLEPPGDRFWADPFAVPRADKDYIFVEELLYKKNRGEIAVLETRDGKLLSAKTIIAEPYHMSYPCIIDHDGDLYMVPETRQKRSIDIWKNVSFPDAWTPLGALMEDVSAGDTTLFRHDGRWWMFTNLSRTTHLRSVDELHAFYTDDPSPVTQAWTPHALNPLVRDTRFARQGGRVFVDEEGRLIRSAQDTAVRYGYAVLLFHVEALTPTSFAETLLHKIEPDWHDDVVGMHTFERRGDLSIFDACFVKRRLRPRS